MNLLHVVFDAAVVLLDVLVIVLALVVIFGGAYVMQRWLMPKVLMRWIENIL